MARAIDIQNVIEEIKYSLEIPSYGEHDKGFDHGLEYVLDLIEKSPTITPPNEWVSVEERLPNSQEDVLVVAFWHERWQTMVGWHSDMGRKWRIITPHGEREPGGVTHWMPLPAPPDKDNNVPGKTPNEPLTLEQLREMDGDPVWVKCLKPNKYINPPVRWRILEKSITGTFGVWDGEDSLIERNYGTDWLAYRRPPEGEEGDADRG